MGVQLSEPHGNSNQAEPPADVRVSVGSVPSRSRPTPGIPDRAEDGRYYQPLLQAAVRGDWEFAKRFFQQDVASKTAIITSRFETVLHIAALSAQDQFVEKLVELTDPGALEKVDCGGRTALHIAVLCGRIRMVKALVRRNPKLMQIADKEGRVPLAISAQEASMHKEIVWFLAEKTTDEEPSHPFSSPFAIKIIIDLTFAGHHDITLYLVGKYPHLKAKEGAISILEALSRKESHFLSGTRLSVLETLIYKWIPVDLNYERAYENSRNKQTSRETVIQSLTRSLWNAAKKQVPTIKRIHEVKLKHVAAIELAKQYCSALSYMEIAEIKKIFKERDILALATCRGMNELVKLCLQFFPQLIWELSLLEENLWIIALRYRQEKIVGFFIKVSSTNKLSLVPGPTPLESERIMGAAAEFDEKNPIFYAVTNVAGAAFQMQRELQWYKAAEGCIMRTTHLAGQGLWKIFVEKHKDLLEKGEKWMKDTANSSMLVSTLIATVLFAAVFTVPGGIADNTGVPLLLGKDSLLIFIISDALGLFSSVAAILLFLAILTSRYEALDFLESLPRKIIIGLSLLLLSLAFMLVTFTATLKIVLDERREWVFIPITLLATLPMALFIVLQLPLLYQMVKSTYGPSIFQPEGIWDGVNYTVQD